MQGRIVLSIEGIGVGAAFQEKPEDLSGWEAAQRVVLDHRRRVPRRGQVDEGGALAVSRVESDELVDELLQLECLLGRAVPHGLGNDDEEVNDDDECAVKVGHVEGGRGRRGF